MKNPIFSGGELSLETDKIWQSAQRELRAKLPSDVYETWIKPLTVKLAGPETLEITSPNEFFLSYVKGHYSNEIESLLGAGLGALGRQGAKIAYGCHKALHGRGVA